MQSRATAYLRERYGFGAWHGRNRLEENLFIWQFFLREAVLPRWRPHRIQTIETPPPAAAVPGLRGPLPQWPRCIQSIWQSRDGPPDALISLDIFECPSRAAAHEHFVSLLAEVQSPLLALQEQSVLGDVVFSGPDDWALFCARANLVYTVRNAGRALVPATEIARQLDREVCERPPTTPAEVAPRVDRFEAAAPVRPGAGPVPLELAAEAPRGEPVMYKFYSRSGEVFVEGGRLAYRPTTRGAQAVTVYAIAGGSGTTRRELGMTIQRRRGS